MPRNTTSSSTISPNNTDMRPTEQTRDMECPEGLGPVAREEWDRLVAELTRGTDFVKIVDRGMLAVYCAAYADWLEAETAIHKYGVVMKSPNGYPMQSPYVSIAQQKAATMLSIAREFGFTPASRGRFPRIVSDRPMLDLSDLVRQT